MKKQLVFVAIGLVVGIVIGAGSMASSKAAAVANIITTRNQELTELKAKHSAELAAAYASVKDKVAEALANVSAEELGSAAEEEILETIEKAGEITRGILDYLDPKKAKTKVDEP